jgi:hypothetical protein
MKNITIYVVFHDEESFNFFKQNNFDLFYNENVKLFNVGQMPYYTGLTANRMLHNIEHLPSLLTFTAWYAIAKNDICLTDYVGIFEYDVKLKPDFEQVINSLQLDNNTIYGFINRKLPDSMFLQCVPNFTKLLTVDEYFKASHKNYWNATSNFIMPKKFLSDFVDWYYQFVPEILIYPEHGHFHERAVNVFAALREYQNKSLPLLEHFQRCSHGINI